MKYQIPKRAISFILYRSGNSRGFHKGARILLYHSVGNKEVYDTMGLRIPEENFTEQMEYLSSNAYNVISLKCLLNSIETGNSIDSRTVVITFDDGYKDNIETVIPVAQEYGFPIAIFVNCCRPCRNMAGSNGNYWSEWEYFSLEDIKTIASSSVTIGSHSFSHKRLTGKKTEIYRELSESKSILEQKIGEKVDMFSYPYGIFNDGIKDMLSELGYVSACSSIIGANTPFMDVFELRRTEITAFDTIHEFEKKLSGYYDWLGYFQRKRYYERSVWKKK